MTIKELELQGDLRRAIETWLGGPVSGPWDDLLELLSTLLTDGYCTSQSAARLDLLLQRTQGGIHPEACGVCGCPMPGMKH